MCVHEIRVLTIPPSLGNSTLKEIMSINNFLSFFFHLAYGPNGTPDGVIPGSKFQSANSK